MVGARVRGARELPCGLLLMALTVALACTLSGCGGAKDSGEAPAAPAAVPAPVEQVSFEVREVPVYREELTRETIPLRFYEERPSVAYVSPADFYRLMLPGGTLSQERVGEGVWHLVSDTGADPAHAMAGGLGGEATVDVGRGTLSTPDICAFTNLMSLVQDGMANTYLDGMAYARVADARHESEPVPQTIDFERYGIDLYEDVEGVYLPFQTLSMLFSDLHYNYASFNGTTVYVNDDNRYPAMHRRDPAFSDPILDADERASDLAEFGYAHLCLAIDYLYGRPGVHFAYGEELDEVGLDGLLESLGETGVAIRDALRSRDLARYMVGLDALCALMDDGGHTYIDALYFTDLMDNEGRQELLERYMACRDDARDPLGAFVREAMERLPRNYDQSLAFDKLHDDAFGDERYVVEGDTALIVLDSFNGIDYEGWEDYYAGRGERPSATEPYDDSGMIDSAAIVLDGLERAAADPSVRNVVLDVSNNGGGSLDVVALVCAIMTGDASLRFENTLMGTVEREEFDVDVNLDGSFDERDGEPAYPGLTFAVLTGPGSFSCGNIAPARLKDEGILVMGTRARGGACAVEMGVLADGMAFQMSSWQARCVDAANGDIDGGVVPDVDLVERFGTGTQTVELERGVVEDVPDYAAFFDVSLLGQVMDEWYGARALDEAA